jgi:bile acid:Na+ symporter, BASS family
MPETRTILDLGVIIITVLIMGSVGMELEESNFRSLGQIKWKFLLTFAAQVMILPALGFLLTYLLNLPAHISAGILLLAACPVGDIANLYTLLARGNEAFSVDMNGISCLISVFTMTLVFAAYDHLLGRIEGTVFGAVYFITEVPLLLAAVAVCRRKCADVDLQFTGTLDGAGE